MVPAGVKLATQVLVAEALTTRSTPINIKIKVASTLKRH